MTAPFRPGSLLIAQSRALDTRGPQQRGKPRTPIQEAKAGAASSAAAAVGLRPDVNDNFLLTEALGQRAWVLLLDLPVPDQTGAPWERLKATASPTPSVPRHHRQPGPCDVSPRQEESTMLWERPRSRDGSQPATAVPGGRGAYAIWNRPRLPPLPRASLPIHPSAPLAWAAARPLGCGPPAQLPRFASQCGLSPGAAGAGGCRQARRDPTGHVTGSSPDSFLAGPLPLGSPPVGRTDRWGRGGGGRAVGGLSAKGASLVGQSGGGRMVSDSALGNPSAPPPPRQPRSRPLPARHPGTHRTPPGVSNKPKVCPWTPAQGGSLTGLGPWC